MYKILGNNKLNLFVKGILKPYTEQVWTLVAHQLAYKLRPKTVCISIYSDRHDYQIKFKKSLNLFTNGNNIINDSKY